MRNEMNPTRREVVIVKAILPKSPTAAKSPISFDLLCCSACFMIIESRIGETIPELIPPNTNKNHRRVDECTNANPDHEIIYNPIANNKTFLLPSLSFICPAKKAETIDMPVYAMLKKPISMRLMLNVVCKKGNNIRKLISKPLVKNRRIYKKILLMK